MFKLANELEASKQTVQIEIFIYKYIMQKVKMTNENKLNTTFVLMDPFSFLQCEDKKVL